MRIFFWKFLSLSFFGSNNAMLQQHQLCQEPSRLDIRCIRCLSPSHTHSLSLSHTLSLPHTHTLSHSHTLSLSLTHTLSPTHTLSLPHTHYLPLSLSLLTAANQPKKYQRGKSYTRWNTNIIFFQGSKDFETENFFSRQNLQKKTKEINKVLFV